MLMAHFAASMMLARCHFIGVNIYLLGLGVPTIHLRGADYFAIIMLKAMIYHCHDDAQALACKQNNRFSMPCRMRLLRPLASAAAYDGGVAADAARPGVWRHRHMRCRFAWSISA